MKKNALTPCNGNVEDFRERGAPSPGKLRTQRRGSSRSQNIAPQMGAQTDVSFSERFRRLSPGKLSPGKLQEVVDSHTFANLDTLKLPQAVLNATPCASAPTDSHTPFIAPEHRRAADEPMPSSAALDRMGSDALWQPVANGEAPTRHSCRPTHDYDQDVNKRTWRLGDDALSPLAGGAHAERSPPNAVLASSEWRLGDRQRLTFAGDGAAAARPSDVLGPAAREQAQHSAIARLIAEASPGVEGRNGVRYEVDASATPPAAAGDEQEATHAMAEVTSLGEFQQIRVLGKGAYARVSLVKHAASGRFFALKALHKAQVVCAKKQVDHVNNERRLLSICDHPFVLELSASFQDTTHLYLLLEPALGGELFKRLVEVGPFDLDTTRFYAACVCAALGHLHNLSIVHRDLKPENALIDAQGYIKLVDLGFAKIVRAGERTWTFCGTPEYLAPEIIQRKGYDANADWWTFGVMLVEMLCGITPFLDENGGELQTFNNICECKVEWEKLKMPKAAEETAKQLLVINPSERLGSFEMGNAKALHRTELFAPIDFARLERREVTAPFVPQVDYEAEKNSNSAQIVPPSANPAPNPARSRRGSEIGDLSTLFPDFDILVEKNVRSRRWSMRRFSAGFAKAAMPSFQAGRRGSRDERRVSKPANQMNSAPAMPAGFVL